MGVFIGCLKRDLQDDMLAQGQTTLARAIELARIYEQKQLRHRTSFRPTLSRPLPSTTRTSHSQSLTVPRRSPGAPVSYKLVY